MVESRTRKALLPGVFLVFGLVIALLKGAAVEGAVLASTELKGSTVEIEGQACSCPHVKGDNAVISIDARLVRVGDRAWATREKAMLIMRNGQQVADLLYSGCKIVARCRIEKSCVEESWLADRGLSATAIVGQGDLLEVEGGGLLDPDELIHRARTWMSESLRSSLTHDTYALAEGVALSKLDDIDPETLEDLRRCGLSHLVAVSGLHVCSAAAIMLSILLVMGVGRTRRYLLTSVAAAMVMVLAAFRVSATRAAIMACMSFGGAVLGREYDPMAGLSVAGLILLAVNPLSLYSPGFQFSFAATLGIVIAVRRKKRTGRIRTFLTVCIAAQLGLAPLFILKGDPVPLTAIAANLLAVPLVGPILWAGWLVSAVSAVSVTMAKVLALFPSYMLKSIRVVASLLSKIPAAGGLFDLKGLLSLGVYLAGLLGILVGIHRKKSILKPALFVFLALAVAVQPVLTRPFDRGGSRVTFLDVGQGDSVLVQDESGGIALIDGGPDEEGILETLERRGVGCVDLAVATHPHHDHIAGLNGVIRRMPVGQLLDTGLDASSCTYRELVSTAGEKRIPVTTAVEGMTINLTAYTSLEVLYAPRSLQESPENLNDCSIVLMMRTGGVNFLLTGDIEAWGQRKLLSRHPGVDCDVLKVPHQGAADSFDRRFIQSCRPSVAVVSVGKGNPYGHPSPEHLGYLESRGAVVYRTDIQGDIELTTLNGRIGVSTGKPGSSAHEPESARTRNAAEEDRHDERTDQCLLSVRARRVADGECTGQVEGSVLERGRPGFQHGTNGRHGSRSGAYSGLGRNRAPPGRKAPPDSKGCRQVER